jgi:hypothetical protein
MGEIQGSGTGIALAQCAEHTAAGSIEHLTMVNNAHT